MTRIVYFAYGVFCHLLFLGLYGYMAAFFAGLPLIPKTIDSPAAVSWGWALAINGLLVLAFGLQHSVMARPGFKQVWTRVIPQPIERSTYVLASCIALAGLVAFWQPINVVVWDLPAGAARWTLWSLFAAGWLMVPLVSLMINHFDLFGTRQVWLHLQAKPYTPLPFRTPLLYKRVRHPLYIGWALAFWATPTMTVGHLALAAALTGYMLVAVLFEERDLVAHFGRPYEEYRRRVPAFVPLPGTGVQSERDVLPGSESLAA